MAAGAGRARRVGREVGVGGFAAQGTARPRGAVPVDLAGWKAGDAARDQSPGDGPPGARCERVTRGLGNVTVMAPTQL